MSLLDKSLFSTHSTMKGNEIHHVTFVAESCEKSPTGESTVKHSLVVDVFI